MSQPTPTQQTERPFLTRAYNLSSVDEARALYDEWAGTYDKDLADPSHDWVAPALAAATLLDYFHNARGDDGRGETLEILDAGCGTGIVGAALAKQCAAAAATTTTTTTTQKKPLELAIDGNDLSTGMLDVARKTGAYRRLETADLSSPLALPDRCYDGVICVGVLTEGHVGPGVLAEFVRVLKPGGCAVATVRGDIWVSGGYEGEIRRLAGEGQVEVLSAREEDSLRGASIKMRLPVLKRL